MSSTVSFSKLDCVVLKQLKCPSCVVRENVSEMPTLPSDTIPVPPAYSIPWPELEDPLVKGGSAIAELKKERSRHAPTVRIRFCGDTFSPYIYTPVLRLNAQLRYDFFKDLPGGKFAYSNTADFVMLDESLLNFLEAKKGVFGKAAAALCRAQLKTFQDPEIIDTLRSHWEAEFGVGQAVDLAQVHNEIARLYSVLHQAGREEVLKSHRHIASQYAISLPKPVEQATFQKKLPVFNTLAFWKDVCKRSQAPFSLTGEDAFIFRKDQALGRHRQLHLTYVPPRPTSVKYVFELAPGCIWDCSEDKKTLNTLQRILWETEQFPREGLELFTSQFNEETVLDMGYRSSYVLRSEGDTHVICPMQFLRSGFLGSVIYTATVPTKDIRKALLLNNVGSLSTKVLQVDPSAAAELNHLSLIYSKLFDAADHVHKLKQQTRSEVSEGLPTAQELLEFMRGLDRKEKSPEEFYLLAFLGLAFFLGLRSGEMGILMSLMFKNQDLSNYNMLIADEDNDDRLVFSTFQCKTRVNDLKTVPLPLWLEKWVRDYELHGRPSLLRGQTHEGMWVTATGLPTHHSILGKESNHGSEFRYIIKLLTTHFGESTISDFTDLRAIFFNGEGEECCGSMMNLIAHAQEYLPNKRQKTDAPVLEDKDGLKAAMAELFRSKSQDEYTKKCKTPIKFICERLNAVKKYLWEELASRPAF